MPSILTDADKETVKRTVPKPSNKILAVAVARLYVAYPDPQRWIYTGLQGAAVLANDLVGHTFWIKLVDVSVCDCPNAMEANKIANCSTYSLPAGVLFGIRRSTMTFLIIRIAPSSTRLSSKNARPPYRSQMKRRLRRLLRR